MPPMNLQFERRRRAAVAALVAGLALAGGAVAVASGGGSSAGAGRVTTASLSTFQHAIVARLRAENLSYRWVVCVPSGQRFAGVGVVRCNVDFGEPHIVAYCSVLRGGRLVTSEDDAAIPCGHDDSGYSATIVQYP